MKIGLYLAYPPSVKTLSLKQEGLGRYLSLLTKAFVNNDYLVTIACPKWLVPSVEELIEEENINKDNIEFLVSNNIPILYKIYLSRFKKKVKTKKKKGKIVQATLGLSELILNSLIYTRNIFVFIILLVFGSVLLILLSPILIFMGIVLFVYKLTTKILGKIFDSGSKNSIKVSIKNIIKGKKKYLKVGPYVRTIINSNRIKETIRLNSAKDIRRKIKYMRNKPDIWYSPMAFWPEFNLVDGPKVICIPDLVTSEFASKFSEYKLGISTNAIRKTIETGMYFICYCDHVSKTLLINDLSVEEIRVKTIPHAMNDLNVFLNVGNYFNKFNLDRELDANKFFARNIILKSLAEKNLNMHEYLYGGRNGFSFKDIKYIFYSSQVRANKNMLNLIKAYEYILREKNIPIKLILTCNLEADQEIKTYIHKNRLQYDILSFYSVSNQTLAALYMCAELVVNPTLYEGGFPFTFGEGMSVGTPSVMSNIPQVTDVTKDYDLDNYIFDPYDYKDIANKIIYGINHRNELFDNQSKLYQALSIRTWDDVGKEYIETFKYFINLSTLKEVNG